MKKQLSILVSILIFVFFIAQCFNKEEEKKAASTPNKEFSLSAAYDSGGSKYLVAIRGDVSSSNNVTAQFMNTSGTLTGSRLSAVGSTDSTPIVLFDGTNYLLIWADEGNPGVTLTYFYGQFINASGINVGSKFEIATEIGAINQKPPRLIGGVFDGNNYFVVFTTAGGGSAVDIRGKFFSPSAGNLGSKFNIVNAAGQQRDGAVAFDGTNILVVWVDGRNSSVRATNPCGYPEDIYGQFITKSSTGTAGTLSGANFIIDDDGFASDMASPSVSFDGINYLIVWHDENNATTCIDEESNGDVNLSGKIINKSGTEVVAKFSISTATGVQFGPRTAFDGTNFLVTWTDMRKDSDLDGICDSNEGTCWDIYGQYVGTNGALVGTEFVINNDAGNQFGGVLGFNNAKYLIMVNTGVTWELNEGSFFAKFVTP